MAKTSAREVGEKRGASNDLCWKVALGTETMERPFAKRTLQLFCAQLPARM